MEKNKLLKFEHIVLLSTSNFESSFREISTKGEERKRRESKKKKKKKKKIGKPRPSSLLFFSFLIPEIESEKKSKENK